MEYGSIQVVSGLLYTQGTHPDIWLSDGGTDKIVAAGPCYPPRLAHIVEDEDPDGDDILERPNSPVSPISTSSIPVAHPPASPPSSYLGTISRRGASSASKPKGDKQEHSEDKWEQMRQVIWEYYIQRNYTLRTVVEILAGEPWSFHATERMYKRRIKRWGLEKNLTEGRVARLLKPGTVKQGVRKVGVDLARVNKYLRRKLTRTSAGLSESEPPGYYESLGVDHEPLGIPELSGDGVLQHELHELPAGCSYLSRPGERFRIHVLDTSSTSEDGEGVYKADSWGAKEYHDLSTRLCDDACPCRRLFPPDDFFWATPSHSFSVESAEDHIHVRLSHDLMSLIQQIIPTHVINAAVIPQLTSQKRATKTTIMNGFILLKHYNDLLAKVDSTHCYDSSHGLRLLVDGLLSDGEVWSRYGWEYLRSKGIIDDNLLRIFRQQRLVRDILNLDSGFKAADSPFETVSKLLLSRQPGGSGGFRGSNGLGESPWPAGHFSDDTGDIQDSSSYQDLFISSEDGSHGELQLSPEDWCGDGDSSVLSYESFHGPILLQGHYDLSEMYDRIPQDLPPSLSPGLAGQNITAQDTLAMNDYGVSAAPAELFGEWASQAYLDKTLVKVCAYEELGAIMTWVNLGADVNACVQMQERDCSPLTVAIRHGRPDVIRYLVGAGARLESDSSVLSPLMTSVRTGNIAIAALLLELGADINACVATSNQSNRAHRLTALTEAAKSHNLEMFKHLLFHDTTFALGLKDVHTFPPDDPSPVAGKTNALIDACLAGNLQTVLSLLRSGAPINALTLRGTALSAACRARKRDIVALLLKHGADAQLASIHLTRSGLPSLAQDLVRRAFAPLDKGFANLRNRFVRQYTLLTALASTTNSAALQSFPDQFPHYRAVWASGIDTMQRICRGDTPTDVGETVAFLAVVRALAETLAGESGDAGFLDRFDADLGRWQQVFVFDAEVEAYREVVKRMWGVVPEEGACWLDKDFEDLETLERFRELVMMMIEGARKPLGLGEGGGGGGMGLEASLRGWKRRRADGCGNPNGDGDRDRGRGSARFGAKEVSGGTPPPSSASGSRSTGRNAGAGSELQNRPAVRTRRTNPSSTPAAWTERDWNFYIRRCKDKAISQPTYHTRPESSTSAAAAPAQGPPRPPAATFASPDPSPDPSSSPNSPHLFAEYLMRGSIFAILLFFLQSIRPDGGATIFGAGLAAAVALGTLRRRMGVMSGYVGRMAGDAGVAGGGCTTTVASGSGSSSGEESEGVGSCEFGMMHGDGVLGIRFSGWDSWSGWFGMGGISELAMGGSGDTNKWAGCARNWYGMMGSESWDAVKAWM